MNSGENIKNALKVIYQTYDNVQKLMEYTKTIAEEKTDYINSVPKFLRRKSDNATEAWLLMISFYSFRMQKMRIVKAKTDGKMPRFLLWKSD